MSRLGARLVQDEEETQAQNKIIFALLLLLAIYPAMFFFLWALFWLTPMGAVIALAMSYAFIVYHVKIVDDNYESCVSVVVIETQILKPTLVLSG
jgi:glycerol-3-phosphate O-acyltransferase / dihydroxyacetone phosphate acyltransferase